MLIKIEKYWNRLIFNAKILLANMSIWVHSLVNDDHIRQKWGTNAPYKCCDRGFYSLAAAAKYSAARECPPIFCVDGNEYVVEVASIHRVSKQPLTAHIKQRMAPFRSHSFRWSR